jgi:hypothetical protein
MTRTIVVTGAGGVGKTTLSAAMGVALARTGLKTLVLTIDPAKRLADALGVSTLGDEPTPVATVDGMWAAMLDVSASWEAIIHRYADPDVGDRLLVNPYFRAIADRFPAAQAYAAGERTAEYIESRSYDVIVVDTPPSGGGIDFFRAPATTGDLVSGKLLKWLTGSHLPGRSLLYRFTAKPMLRIADTILGGPMLSDVADFLLDLRTMYDACPLDHERSSGTSARRPPSLQRPPTRLPSTRPIASSGNSATSASIPPSSSSTEPCRAFGPRMPSVRCGVSTIQTCASPSEPTFVRGHRRHAASPMPSTSSVPCTTCRSRPSRGALHLRPRSRTLPP